LFLTNFPGAVKTLRLSSTSKEFLLELAMPGLEETYKTYEIRIYDADNKIIVPRELNDDLSSIKSGEKIGIRLEKDKFKGNQIYKSSIADLLIKGSDLISRKKINLHIIQCENTAKFGKINLQSFGQIYLCHLPKLENNWELVKLRQEDTQSD
jgi:hypothetical protein